MATRRKKQPSGKRFDTLPVPLRSDVLMAIDSARGESPNAIFDRFDLAGRGLKKRTFQRMVHQRRQRVDPVPEDPSADVPNALLRKRRMALTGLDWEVVSAYDVAPTSRMDKGLADAAAEFARDALTGVKGFDKGLRHLAYAVGEGVGVVELIWLGRGLSALRIVPSSRLVFDYNQDVAEGSPARLRIRTDKNETPGVPADWGKFVVHAPTGRNGFPQRGALLRVLTLNFLIRSYAVKDWATFCEIFGMPIRSATYGPSATAEEKQEMLDMLRLMGTDLVAVFSESMKLNIIESTQRGTSPYEAFLKWLDEQATIAVLGQTLTTQMSDSGGSFAAAQVHKGVEEALADDDRKAEGETIRDQVLAPMIKYSFGRPDAPVPFFRRRIAEPVDRMVEAQVLGAAVDMGMTVEIGYAHETLGIPIPEGANPNDALKKPAPPPGGVPGFGGGGGFGGGTFP